MKDNRKQVIRIGNIAIYKLYGKTVYNFEVLQYYPNDKYNKQDEYIPEKDEVTGEILAYKPSEDSCVHISPSCFETEECCFVIGWFNYKEEEPDFFSVGGRPFRLEEEDLENFKEVMKWFYNNWKKYVVY